MKENIRIMGMVSNGISRDLQVSQANVTILRNDLN